MAEKRTPKPRPASPPAHPPAQRRDERRGRARAPRRPLPPGEQFFTPGATGLRRAVETRSAAPLVFLFRLPRWVLPIALVALLLVGLAVPGLLGALAVLPVLGFVGWLAYLSWPSLGLRARLLRVAVGTFLVLLLLDRLGGLPIGGF